MIASIRRKTWQNGPAFSFNIPVNAREQISGFVRRYQVKFQAETDIPAEMKKQIIKFSEGLGLGKVICR